MDESTYDKVNRLAHAYFEAKSVVLDQGYLAEIEWQENQLCTPITEMDFMREAAWTILSSGLSEKSVRAVFPKLSKSFNDWNCIQITKQHSICKKRALKSFASEKKIDAIIYIADFLDRFGLQKIINSIKHEGIEYLFQFPFLGPATSYHLAKNVGFNVSKPDRHLKRIATAAGFECSKEMCKNLAIRINEMEAVIDVVLWRYATLNQKYLETFSSQN